MTVLNYYIASHQRVAISYRGPKCATGIERYSENQISELVCVVFQYLKRHSSCFSMKVFQRCNEGIFHFVQQLLTDVKHFVFI